MNRPARGARPLTPWKPPLWLLAVDVAGIVTLMLGLLMHYAPHTAVAQRLPPGARLPLLVIGGLSLVFCTIAILLSVLRHHRRG